MTAVTQPKTGPVAVPVVEVYLTGRLDLECLASVQATLAAAVGLHPDQLVVDMAGCGGIDAEGVALLLDVHRQLVRAGGVLTLRAPTPPLRRILRIARVDQVLHVVPEEAPPPRRTTGSIRSTP